MLAAGAKNADIMIVDDTPANLRLLVGVLEQIGHRVRAFPRGRQALAAAVAAPPELIILDINMPDMDGYEVCEALKQHESLGDVPVIFISALHEPLDKVRAFNSGGVDYIPKPFHIEEVVARVDTQIKLRRLQQEAMADSWLATIVALAKLAECRDDDTGKHIERVQGYCRVLAGALVGGDWGTTPVTDHFVDAVTCASALHDIGKVGVPDAVLLKPGKLTDEEFAIIKQHPMIGAATLDAVRTRYPSNVFINTGIEIARSHHEKWNGQGYPDGLAGDAIPLAARIVAIADVYDALRSERCYKPAFAHAKAVDIIVEGGGGHFDPRLTEVFVAQADEFDAIRQQLCE